MLPSDMLLKALNRVIEGYNDEIVVNASGLELGKHVEPTSKRAPTSTALSSQKPAPKHLTVSARAPVRSRVHTLDDHQEEVTSVILALMLFGFWFLK